MNNIIEKKYFSSNHILNIYFNKDSVNSINNNMLHELYNVLDEVKNNDIRCLIISTAKNNFCAGADLKERQKLSRQEAMEFLDKLNIFFKTLENLEVISIASIHGACLGGGLELALSCDFRVSSSSGIFGFPETSLGIIPGAGGTQRMTRLFGISKSMKWIFSARKYDAKSALDDGIVDYLVDVDDLHQFSLNFALKIIEKSPIALKAAKSSILSSQYDEGFNIERKKYLDTLNSRDRDEGLLSFKEKRPPIWKNK